MSLNKLFIVFGIILVVFASVVFFQFRTRSGSTSNKGATVKINDQTFKVEVVETPDKQQLGLSGRKSLPKDRGMLFVFDEAEYHTFWMKNMKFPIDIIFIRDAEIVSIAQNAQPPKSPEENLTLYKSGEPVDKVLEINANLVEEYDIQEGDLVEINLKK